MAVVVAAGALALAGCGTTTGSTTGSAARQDGGTAIDVVATTPVVADFVRNVGGGRVHVDQILKPGLDPHDYEPSPADVQAIADADVVVKSGVGLEHWLDDTVSSSGYGGQVVDSSHGVTIRPGDSADPMGDPHIWHDPADASIMVGNIAAALESKDPAGAATYQKNATAYQAQLAALDARDKAEIASIPAAQRQLVTNHDAFGYYCARYGITFVGSIIPSFDSSAELSGKELSDLVTRIKQTGVRAVFSESSLPPKTAQTVAQEAGVQVVGGEDSLFADGLGPVGSPGGTYLGAERHNTDTIVKALGGRV
ncbi:MAG TPA: metal ABC transporter substrate-binding protein [Mycobacteriales bacterium]|nr:metal ABC transporter substrate-binding protein [Mycobacteriales bacterium]